MKHQGRALIIIGDFPDKLPHPDPSTVLHSRQPSGEPDGFPIDRTDEWEERQDAKKQVPSGERESAPEVIALAKKMGDACREYLQAAYAAGRASMEARVRDLMSRLGKPRCLDCNSAGITNCSHFDNCGGRWKYELEERAEIAEARLQALSDQQKVDVRGTSDTEGGR